MQEEIPDDETTSWEHVAASLISIIASLDSWEKDLGASSKKYKIILNYN